MQAFKPLIRLFEKQAPKFLFAGNRTRNVSSVVRLSLPLVSDFGSSSNNNSRNNNTMMLDSKQCFHTTAITPLSERKRRRRRGDGSALDAEDPTNNNNSNSYQEHSPVTDRDEFNQAGQDLLQKLQTAVEPMKAINDPFIVTRSGEFLLKIELDPATGRYEVEVDPLEQVAFFRSPVSGSHSYFLSQKTNEWVDTVDLHSLEGLFVRDLIRSCQGVPKL